MRTALRHALLFLLLAVAPAAADPTRADVEALLSAYEPQGTAAALRRLGPAVEGLLIALATDASTPDLRRVRALAALQVVPGAGGRDTCVSLVRRRAGAAAQGGVAALEVAACAATLGVFGPEVRGELLPLIAHPIADVRIAAARSLSQGRLAEAPAALRRQLAREDDVVVRRALHGALQRLAQP